MNPVIQQLQQEIKDLKKQYQSIRPMQSMGVLTSWTSRGVSRVSIAKAGSRRSQNTVPVWG